MGNLGHRLKLYWPYLALGLTFIVVQILLPSRLEEPDSFYHYAISHQISEKGFLSTWPALPDLGWNYQFTDKEFLYHQFTAFFYKLGKVPAINLFGLTLATGIVLLLSWLANFFCGRTGILITALALLNFSFFFRLTLLRPHLAGIFLVLTMISGLVKKNRWLLSIGCFLFPLSYHALYVPVFVMGLWWIFERETSRKNIVLYGLLPFIAGILINPYFPGTLAMMWLGIKIGLNTSLAVNIGEEAKALPFSQSLDSIGPYLVFNLWFAWNLRKDITRGHLLQFGILAFTFLGLYFISPRSIEYFIPFEILFISSGLALSTNVPEARQIVVLFLLIIGIRYSGSFFIDKSRDTRNVLTDVSEVIKQLPANETGKVFNCEWSLGSLVLHYRPSYKVNEALDPNFLFLSNPEMAKVKSFILNMPPPNLYDPLKNIFKADYVLCLDPKVTSILKNDPRFEILSIGKSVPTPFLFKVIGL